jgi:hypothetical protein
MTELAPEKVWIAAQVFSQKVDAPPVKSHHRGIGEDEAVPRVQLKNRVLCRRVAGIRLEYHIDGRETSAGVIV